MNKSTTGLVLTCFGVAVLSRVGGQSVLEHSAGMSRLWLLDSEGAMLVELRQKNSHWFR